MPIKLKMYFIIQSVFWTVNSRSYKIIINISLQYTVDARQFVVENNKEIWYNVRETAGIFY